jgi:hypothetical protein
MANPRSVATRTRLVPHWKEIKEPSLRRRKFEILPALTRASHCSLRRLPLQSMSTAARSRAETDRALGYTGRALRRPRPRPEMSAAVHMNPCNWRRNLGRKSSVRRPVEFGNTKWMWRVKVLP